MGGEVLEFVLGQSFAQPDVSEKVREFGHGAFHALGLANRSRIADERVPGEDHGDVVLAAVIEGQFDE